MSNNIFLNNNTYLNKNELILNVKNDITFKKLLYMGSNVNIKIENGWGLLFELVSSKSQDKIKDILNFGADINARDNSGKNALYWAIYYKNLY